MKEQNKGVQCRCGKFTPFSLYVYAHWDIPLLFTCPDCEVKYNILAGDVSPPIPADYKQEGEY